MPLTKEQWAKYPPSWKNKIRPRILHRAGLVVDNKGHIVTNACCEWCGAENYKLHPDTGSKVVLTVAHLDHDPANWDVEDSRLAALCQRCHLQYDAQKHAVSARKTRERKLGAVSLPGMETLDESL